ncbi:formimidoylglutamate deiminase [Actinoplanes oblitus]|uniref:Formimidoylglutamate deiminase n=1 Tax=Actinoplanes oblitus TaxID=3040509 RepID=A0ABY8W5K4_9ACTN|nr:formimidoylglutamate deiminase [Actinoplanes oblitus]WIM92782.1 formimidoylglutamate deiminase [Actinoplanes oblitus]
MRIFARRLVLPGAVRENVLLQDGAVHDATPGTRADLRLGTVVPAFANTHSHAFHRLLRGRTNAGGGDFWEWRQRMYAVAQSLDPDLMFEVALLVYGEMVAAGYASVCEFHYLHHTPSGRPYPRHEMELALAAAATEAGIRLTLLDTLYLHGGFGQPLHDHQRRFGDGSVRGWLDRWHDLRSVLRGATLGAAFHSVRAVAPDELRDAVAGLPAEVPLHVHLSEQPAENADCLAATGLTPAGLLASVGALSPRTTVVHATHLTDADVATLGAARVTVSMCPSTEGDLGDGLGRARDLADAGARITIGSDQNVTVDPFEELRLLERGARLASGRRGVFSPAELWAIGAAGTGLVEIDTGSVRTLGTHPAELFMSATAADVRTVITDGVVRGRPDLDRAARLYSRIEAKVTA